MWLFQTGADRYQSDPDRFADIDQRKLVRFVGYVALGLPIVLYFAAHNPIYATCFRHSISHYFYAPFWGTFFTGALFFIGTYLLVWKGEEIARRDGKLATLAGISAYGVALFPTGGAGCSALDFMARPMAEFVRPAEDAAPDLTAWRFELDFPIPVLKHVPAEWLHYGFALFMFSFLAWFSLQIFTRVDAARHRKNGKLTLRKWTRNAIYYVTGVVIILCILGLIIGFALSAWTSVDMGWWDAGNWTFWLEAVALVAFGLAWMVKGQFFPFLNDKPISPPQDAPEEDVKEEPPQPAA